MPLSSRDLRNMPAQPASQLPTTPAEIEILIARVLAVAAGELANAVHRYKPGAGAGPGANAVADWVAQLVLLRQATAGEVPDFEATARVQALQMLRQHCGAEVSDALLASLIDDVLRIVAKVCATQWH
jgi:hypothetical protein